MSEDIIITIKMIIIIIIIINYLNRRFSFLSWWIIKENSVVNIE